MDFSQAISYLGKAEQELLRLIGSDSSYEDKGRCLEYSQMVHGIVGELENFSRDSAIAKGAPASVLSEQPSEKRTPQDASDDVFPIFFVHDGKLWKVASRSGNSDSHYHKSMPFSDVGPIVTSIRKLTQNGAFTISSMEKLHSDIPVYRIHLTVGALMQVGLLRSAGRGKYEVVPGGPQSDQKWVEALNGLPVRVEYLEK